MPLLKLHDVLIFYLKKKKLIERASFAAHRPANAALKPQSWFKAFFDILFKKFKIVFIIWRVYYYLSKAFISCYNALVCVIIPSNAHISRCTKLICVGEMFDLTILHKPNILDLLSDLMLMVFPCIRFLPSSPHIESD